LRQALELDPQLFAANFNLGIIMGKRGQHAEAADYFEAAHKANPSDPVVLDNLGLAEEQLGRLDAAIEHYELAAQINPHPPSIRQHLERVRKKKAERSAPNS
jgi:tetratricopeptide (TPR) repeat protein